MNPEQIVAYLNELVAIDREGMERLTLGRVKVSRELAERLGIGLVDSDGDTVCGLLGLLGGMFPRWPNGAARIAAEIATGEGEWVEKYGVGSLVKFSLTMGELIQP